MSITRDWPTAALTSTDPAAVTTTINDHVGDARSAGHDPGGIVRETHHRTVTVRLARVLDEHGWVWHAAAVTSTGEVLSRLKTVSSYRAVVEQARLDANWALAASWTSGTVR